MEWNYYVYVNLIAPMKTRKIPLSNSVCFGLSALNFKGHTDNTFLYVIKSFF